MSNELTHENCLEHGNGPCEGDVEHHERYSTVGLDPELAHRTFPRCERHYAEYIAVHEARERRDEEARKRLYCVHGTFIGDPYGPDYLCEAMPAEKTQAEKVRESLLWVVDMMNSGQANPADVYPAGRYQGD